MKKTKQVCTKEQAKKLKELGVIQNSHFSWCGDEIVRLLDNGADGISYSDWVFVSETDPVNSQELDYREDVPSAKPFAAAFTVAELGCLLPHEDKNGFFVYSGYSSKCKKWECELIEWDKKSHHGRKLIVCKVGETEAEARAGLLIWLIEKNISQISEINNRFTFLAE